VASRRRGKMQQLRKFLKLKRTTGMQRRMLRARFVRGQYSIKLSDRMAKSAWRGMHKTGLRTKHDKSRTRSLR
jgi:hypothetical protein